LCALESAPRESADDYRAAIGQIPSETFRHLIPVRGRTSRANDGNLVAIQKFNISAHIQQRRRIVNLAQALRVLRLVPAEQADSGACANSLAAALSARRA
jgi:hypothetical protein